MDHPTLWKFIDGLKKVQKGRDLFHEQLVAGHTPPRKLRRYRLCDETIQRIVQSYANYGIMDYLRGLAHNFKMNWIDLITIHSILDIYSSKCMVSAIFLYDGTEFAHNYEQHWLN